MSESAAKRQPIDLDEFERRLRAPAAQRPEGPEDPLAELARIVGGAADPFAPIFAAGRANLRLAPQNPPAQPVDWDRLAAVAQPRAAFTPTQAPRGTERPAAGLLASAEAVAAERALYASQNADKWEGEPAPGQRLADRGRSRKSIFLMSSALLLVAAGIGGTLALRGHGISSGPAPTILAAAGPVKVRPPSTPPRDPLERSSSFLNQPDTSVVAPAHVVDSEEEPIDLSQIGKTAGSHPGVSDQNSLGAASDGSFFPKPRLVKTVSVRPDGSIISADAPPPVAVEPPPSIAQAPAPFVAPSQPSTPQAEAVPAAVAPTRPSYAAPRSQTAKRPSAFDAVARMAANPRTHSVAVDATDSLKEQRPQPQRQARLATPKAKPAAAATNGSGAWAVQLAAPGTERDARLEIGRLSRKFASELGGRTLGYHSAVARGRTVWRVRVAGLAEPEALALCGKIKSGGGACFVAKN